MNRAYRRGARRAKRATRREGRVVEQRGLAADDPASVDGLDMATYMSVLEELIALEW